MNLQNHLYRIVAKDRKAKWISNNVNQATEELQPLVELGLLLTWSQLNIPHSEQTLTPSLQILILA
jgi:hypothetical protein